jgi:8-oxo-dGTP diphosphatase
MFNTTLCYIEKDGAYLMLHRIKKKNDINHDKWVGIGGKLEEGESPHDCVIREAFEETGLTLISPKYRGLITFISDVCDTEYMHLFTATEYTGEMITDCPEGKLEWVDKSKVCELPIWEGDKIFFDLLNKEERFFSLKLVYENDKLIYHKLDI